MIKFLTIACVLFLNTLPIESVLNVLLPHGEGLYQELIIGESLNHVLSLFALLPDGCHFHDISFKNTTTKDDLLRIPREFYISCITEKQANEILALEIINAAELRSIKRLLSARYIIPRHGERPAEFSTNLIPTGGLSERDIFFPGDGDAFISYDHNVLVKSSHTIESFISIDGRLRPLRYRPQYEYMQQESPRNHRVTPRLVPRAIPIKALRRSDDGHGVLIERAAERGAAVGQIQEGISFDEASEMDIDNKGDAESKILDPEDDTQFPMAL